MSFGIKRTVERVVTDGILFDLDGTLWDSTEACAIAYNQVMKTQENPPPRVTPDDLKALFGLPNEEIGKQIFPALSPDRRRQAMDLVMEMEFRCLRAFPPPPYDGVRETLRALEDIPKFIVSNCASGYIETFLDVTGLGGFFVGHLCPGDTGAYKADNIRRLVREYCLRRPVYVGDTQLDADAARAAGVPFIHAAYGFGKVSGANGRIETIWELTRLLRSEQES